MRKKINLNDGWKYLEHNLSDSGAIKPFYLDGYDDSEWEIVNVPHDSSIVTDFAEKNPSGPRGGYAKTNLCYYTKIFNIDECDMDKEITVEFEGVYMNSVVFINGKQLGTYPFGYTAFRYDLTPYIKAGENRLAVRVNNEAQPGSRWYSGTGIYRPVNLYIKEKVHFTFDDLVIATPFITKDFSVVDVKFNIENNNTVSHHGDVKITIFDMDNNVVAENLDSRSIAAEYPYPLSYKLKVENPSLWCNKNPYLYTCKVEFIENDIVTDAISERFGIREFEFNSKDGFVINGEREFLKGVCIHHDNGCLGASAEKEAFRRKILAVKAMGANAIRTSHNPEAKDFLDLCDEYGMYVMEESFDEWKYGKRPAIFGEINIRQPIFAYAPYFDQWAEKDLSAMIKRDRNHASIVMWSIGNEILELRLPEGEGLSQYLLNIVHEHDLTRPVTVACNGLKEINKTHAPDIMDVCGYNYAEDFYALDHERRPNRLIIGSETASVTAFEKRGKYEKFLELTSLNDLDASAQADAEHQTVEELKKSHVRGRMMRGEQSWKLHKENPFVSGMFIWTGIDYLGEPTPDVWPSISSYFAPIDRMLEPKDAFYFYKSIWSDEDVLYILPHWNLDGYEGKKIPVWCFTNCDEVEIFVNGKSYGKQTLDKENKFHLEWYDVTYEAGEVKAVGTRNGKVIEETIKTTGKSKTFKLELEKDTANVGDLVFAKVAILDENGTVVPNADEKIEFACENIDFVASDNGNPEFSSFQSKELNTLSGHAIGAFRAVKQGTATISVKFVNSFGEEISQSVSVKIDM